MFVGNRYTTAAFHRGARSDEYFSFNMATNIMKIANLPNIILCASTQSFRAFQNASSYFNFE